MANEEEQLGTIRDADWIRHALYTPRKGDQTAVRRNIFDKIFEKDGSKEIDPKHHAIIRGRQYTAGILNFADTTLGGNRVINPLPQFTETADQNIDQVVKGGLGMGRQYWESIDANQQRIYMQFGTVAYNSTWNFWTLFYDYGQASLANRGVVHRLLYSWGKLAGFVVFWKVGAILGIANYIYKGIKSALRRPYTKYCYMRPAMPLFWSKASSIFNAISVNMDLAHGFNEGELRRQIANKGGDATGYEFGTWGSFLKPGLADADIAGLQNIIPDIFQHRLGGMDIRSVASRYQRLANEHNTIIRRITEDAVPTKVGEVEVSAAENAKIKVAEYIRKQRVEAQAQQTTDSLSGRMEPEEYMDKFMNTTFAKGEGTNDSLVAGYEDSKTLDNVVTTLEEDTEAKVRLTEVEGLGSSESITRSETDIEKRIRESTNSLNQQAADSEDYEKYMNTKVEKGGYWAGLGTLVKETTDYWNAELTDGSFFICFGVDYQGEGGESFSNSTQQSSMQASVNEKVSSARSLIFNASGGNLGDGLIGTTVRAVFSGVQAVMAGVASSVGLAGLGVLGGSAFVDIPEFWESSSSNWSSTTYTIPLRSWSGNPLVIQKRIVAPLSMLLAATIPHSAGPNAWTTPFVCKLWSQGRANYQLAMITDLDIRRHVGNIGMNAMGQSTGVDVTITVTNLNKMLHIPITSEFSLTKALGMGQFDEEDNFSDYMASLGGLHIGEMYYLAPKWRLKKARDKQDLHSWLSAPNAIQSFMQGTLIGNILSGVSATADL